MVGARTHATTMRFLFACTLAALANAGLVFDARNLMTVGGGPFWGGIHRLSDTHFVGFQHDIIGSHDSGKTWFVLPGATWPNATNDTDSFGGIFNANRTAFHNLGACNPGKTNITGCSAPVSTRFKLDDKGGFLIEEDMPVSITGLPRLLMYSPAPGDSIALEDGSMIGTAKSILSTGRSLLSVVAVRSTDGEQTRGEEL